MKRFLFAALFLLMALPSFAADRSVLVDGSGNEVGTSSNPLKISLTGGGGGDTSPFLTNSGLVYVDDATKDFAVGGSTTAADLYVDVSTDQTGVKDLSIRGNTVIGDASGDTVSVNAAGWTFANDTTVTLSGGADGLNFDGALILDGASNFVGIGVTPTVELEINNSSNTQMIMREADGDNFIKFFTTGSELWALKTDNTGDLEFREDGSSIRLHIENSNGYVGIGDTTPDALFDVEGNITASGNLEANRVRSDTVIRVGNAAGTVAYSAIDDDSTVSANSGLMVDANDLYVEGHVEIDGNATVGGNIQAVKLFGDGSALTGITAGEFTDSGTTLTTTDANRNLSLGNHLTVDGNIYTIIDSSYQSVAGAIESLSNYWEIAGSSGLKPATGFNDLTVPGNLTVDGVLFVDAIAATNLEVDGYVTAGTDVTASGNISADTYTGQMFTSIPLNMDLSVNSSFLFDKALPFNYTVTSVRLTSDEALADDLTVSVYKDGVEQTTTKATRPSVSTTRTGTAKTVSLAFTSANRIGVKLQSYDNVKDLSTSGFLDITYDKTR